ncbi:hypothetical protein CRG98_008378 [Punica granatum]|uniref:CCHC-type domain-containing protein n=1 Tax=Punica granatum TaxID=22663 RepID=A0A2I0KSC6_PUNGR|nr:hypothetical protein CRG98_008378 [Punica granatum]
MVRLLYELGADISLKQVFLSSIPASLVGAGERLLQARGKRVINCTVGEIQQEIHVTLEDACMKKRVIREVLKGDKSMEKACKRPELYIKCSSKDKTCSYPTKKKKHYKKWKMLKAKSKRYSGKIWKYLRKKRRFGKKYKSFRCYICNRPDHFAKNCPRALKQGVKLVQDLQLPNQEEEALQEVENVESKVQKISWKDMEVPEEEAKVRKEVQILQGIWFSLAQEEHSGWLGYHNQDKQAQDDAKRVRFKPYFQLYVQTPRLFMAQEDEVKQILSELLANGQYQPEPHVAQELLKYPEESLTKKKIQQFLSTVNFLRDFLPKIAKLTCPLEKMLKDASAWSPTQTKAIKELKAQLQSLPPLQIRFTGKKILQTDASDRYWGVVLLEELNGKRHICGYRSGRFKPSEQYYHSTFKEILAVMNGIKKFEFYLVGYKFLVEMDMSSFPKMLKFKQKQLSHPQLLRWAEWFSKFDFEVEHINEKHNTLVDFLSRNKQALTRQTLQVLPIICMFSRLQFTTL